MSEIIEVYAREILDSRGNPTVEAEITTAMGAKGRIGRERAAYPIAIR